MREKKNEEFFFKKEKIRSLAKKVTKKCNKKNSFSSFMNTNKKADKNLDKNSKLKLRKKSPSLSKHCNQFWRIFQNYMFEIHLPTY